MKYKCPGCLHIEILTSTMDGVKCPVCERTMQTFEEFKPKKYWLGSPVKECDICHTPITIEFIDGATKFGPWANMCPKCHKSHGRGVGTGKGQHYRKDETGRFEKIAG